MSYWIWYYGDYEIYHSMKLHLLREERTMSYPAFWHLNAPYLNVAFQKEFECDKSGYMIIHALGDGYVYFEGKKHPLGKKIEIKPGKHCVDVFTAKPGGLPAIYVESDICPSGEGWLCSNQIKNYLPVGYNKYFDSPDKNPEIFPFSYERKFPVRTERTESGILYDFDTELFGILNIENADADETMGVFYGESREEALDKEEAVIYEYVNGNTEYHLVKRAFRYIYIVCKNPEKLTVHMDFEYLPLEKKGAFRCDNELFNKIYDVSEYTYFLNCREGLFDGIKRDRWVWAGDVYQCARINAYLYADEDLIRRSLLGLIGKSPIMQHMNTIVDYSFMWIIGLYEYYMTYGDMKLLKHLLPMANELMEFCEKRLNKDGFIEAIDPDIDWIFIDWADFDKTGPLCAEQILMLQAYKALGEISKVLGKEHKIFTEKAVLLKEKIDSCFWSEELGAYIDSYQSGKNHVTRHANIFAVMYDIATPAQAESIIKNVLKNPDVPQITTPYFKGYELDVCGKIGDFQRIESVMESYWGGMISLGAKTVWEDYNPEETQWANHLRHSRDKYGKSLCHAWGAGPVYLFGRYYLGVYPTSPGYKTFNVEPCLGGLNEISGKVPVCGGEVTVSLSKEKLCVSTTVPGGTLIWKGTQYTLIPNEELVL